MRFLFFKIIITLFILFNCSFSFASRQCRELFKNSFGSEVLTSNYHDIRLAEPDIDNWSLKRLIEMSDKPFRYLEHEGDAVYSVGPVIIHRFSSFSRYDQRILKSIYDRSIRSSWVRLSAVDQAESYFERMAEREGVELSVIKEAFPKDSDEFQFVTEQYYHETSLNGFELGKFSIELKDGTILESNFITNYLVDTIFDIGLHLENILTDVDGRSIKSLKFYHTHPSHFTTVAVPSRNDVLSLEILREFLVDFNGSTNVDYHVYSVTRVKRQLSVGHFSFNY